MPNVFTNARHVVRFIEEKAVMNLGNLRRREACKLTVLAAFASLLFIGPAQGFEFDIRGGNGGGFFRVFCPRGQCWGGLKWRARGILDNVMLICGGFRTDPSTPPRKNWTIVGPKKTFPETKIGESDGGAPLRLECNN